MSPFVRRPAVRSADRRAARGVLLLSLALYTLTSGGTPESPPAELEYRTVRSLARGEGFALQDVPADLAPRDAERLPAERLLRAGPGERAQRRYAVVGVAHAVLGVPFYWAGAALARLDAAGGDPAEPGGGADDGPPDRWPRLLVGWRSALLGALTAALVTLAGRRLGAERVHAWWAGVGYAVTTFAWPQATGGGARVQVAFFLMLALHLVLRVRERFERLEAPHTAELVALGVALIAAPLTGVAAWVPALVLGAAAEVVLRRGHRHLAASRWSAERGQVGRPPAGRGRSAVLVLVPIAVGAALLVALDLWRFGGVLALEWGVPAAADGPGRVAAELLVSPDRGLAWFAPLLFLVPVGIWRLRGEGERLFGRAALGVLLAALISALWLEGPAVAVGWTAGPEALLAALPILAVAVAPALDWAAEERWRRFLPLALAGLGLWTQVPAVVVGTPAQRTLVTRALAGAGEAMLPEDVPRRCAWDLGLAAPWSGWRILRHRFAGLEEHYPADVVFRLPSSAEVEPAAPRQRGFRNLAWVDLAGAPGGRGWPGGLLSALLAALGLVLSRRGLDPAAAP